MKMAAEAVVVVLMPRMAGRKKRLLAVSRRRSVAGARRGSGTMMARGPADHAGSFLASLLSV